MLLVPMVPEVYSMAKRAHRWARASVPSDLQLEDALFGFLAASKSNALPFHRRASSGHCWRTHDQGSVRLSSFDVVHRLAQVADMSAWAPGTSFCNGIAPSFANDSVVLQFERFSQFEPLENSENFLLEVFQLEELGNTL